MIYILSSIVCCVLVAICIVLILSLKEKKREYDSLKKELAEVERNFRDLRQTTYYGQALSKDIIIMIYNGEPIEKIRAHLNITRPLIKTNSPGKKYERIY